MFVKNAALTFLLVFLFNYVPVWSGATSFPGGATEPGPYEAAGLTLEPGENNILYVNKNISGGDGSGNSWENAVPELADALIWAKQNETSWTSALPLTIYVAKGIYRPLYSPADDHFGTDAGRDNAFLLVKYLRLYGGFDPGNGVTGPEHTRVFGENGSVLSGDNTYHVLIATTVAGTQQINGFTITGGNADGTGSVTVNNQEIPRDVGGGLYNRSANPFAVAQCIFTGNLANYGGAGMYNNASPVIINCSFIANHATSNGGGLLNQSGGAMPAIITSTFSGNTARYGGAMHTISSAAPLLTNCVMSGNSAVYGGALFNNLGSAPVFRGCLITGNKADDTGGALQNQDGSSTFINCTIAGNYAAANAGGINAVAGTGITIRNSIVSGNSPFDIRNPDDAAAITASYSFTGGSSGVIAVDNAVTGNLRFAAPVAATASPTTTGDYRLQPGSAAINAGNNAYLPVSGFTDDLDGNARILHGTVDLGAYEAVVAAIVPDGNRVLHVRKGGTGNQSGVSWADALPELALALKWAKENEESWTAENSLKIYVAKETYYPLYSPADDNFGVPAGRDNTFLLVKDVHMYGGFDPGNGINALSDTRVYGSGGTVLSGDVDGSNTHSDHDAYHVIISAGDAGTSLMDGFTVTGGNANVTENILVAGNNISRSNGGGMHNENSSPALRNCHFTRNYAHNGGGIFNSGSSPLVTNCSFTDNPAPSGSGMHNYYSSPTLINCIFVSNSNSFGIYNTTGSYGLVVNCTFYGNTSQGISSAGGWLSVYNSILWDGISGENFNQQNNLTGEGLNAADFFADPGNPAGEDGVFGTEDDGLRIKGSSAAVNAGSNQLYTDAGGDLAQDADMGGNPRLSGSTIDIGAYEYQSLPPAPGEGNILYVKKGGAGNNSGGSWDNALPELADALKWAKENASSWTAEAPLNIYVAKGTYYPLYSPADDNFGFPAGRDNAFLIVKHVKLYGGFDPANSIDDLDDDRLFSESGSVLNGDIDQNDINDDGNVHHVVISMRDVGAAVLDGFTITGGRANSTSGTLPVSEAGLARNSGGGMVNIISNLPINRCIFTGNYAAGQGGALYNNSSSSPVISSCVFYGNINTSNGGAIQSSGSSSPVIVNSLFFNNTANAGGAIYFGSSGQPVIRNVVFRDNTASSGALYFTGSNTPKIYNSIIYDNAGSEIVFSGSYSGSVTITHSTVKGGYPGTGNLDTDPLFVNPGNPDGDDGLWGTADDGLRLQPCSPAINTGDNAAISGTSADIAGNARVAQGNTDRGAYENAGFTLASGAASVLNATGSCSSGGWTYFYDPESLALVVAVDAPVPGLNVTGKLEESPAELQKPFGQTSHAFHIIRRSWSAVAGGALPEPVAVRFFYAPADIGELGENIGLPDMILYKVNGDDAYDSSAEGYIPYAYSETPPATGTTFIAGTFQGLHYAEFGVSSFSSGSLAFLTTALPVTLVSFNAALREKAVHLAWQTSSETNVSHFEAERSGDGRTWQKIGRVTARGESREVEKYSLTDHEAPFAVTSRPSRGILYYRLKMVDLDGAFEYSSLAAVAGAAPAETMVAYPNPATEKLFLRTSLAGELVLYDMTGRKVRSIRVKPGENELDIRGLGSSVYTGVLDGEVVKFLKR